MRIGLVGCVKTKRDQAAPARDMYTSALFGGRRRFVEVTCDRWFILSAKHGLVDPDEVIEPYDVTLTRASARERAAWSGAVVQALESQLGALTGVEFEIHAGAAYRAHGLVDGLIGRGARVTIPAEGLSQGEQLAFYQRGRRSALARSVPPKSDTGTKRREWVDGFYDLMSELYAKCGSYRYLADCDRSSVWPKQGVYFFFEPSEMRENGYSRVVRVGTHALTRSSSTTLWQRLAQHRGNVGGAFPGGGSHRGSVFRFHVGTALLATGNWPPELPTTWFDLKLSSAKVKESEYELECAVSQHIGRMPLLWLGVDDDPGPQSARGVIEARSIALLSNRAREPVDPPSPTWLGRAATRPEVRESGLWNVHHVDQVPDARCLDALRQLIRTPDSYD